MDDALSKMTLLVVAAEVQDNETGDRSYPTSVMCFRVGGKAVQSGGRRAEPGVTAVIAVTAIIGFALAWTLA